MILHYINKNFNFRLLQRKRMRFASKLADLWRCKNLSFLKTRVQEPFWRCISSNIGAKYSKNLTFHDFSEFFIKKDKFWCQVLYVRAKNEETRVGVDAGEQVLQLVKKGSFKSAWHNIPMDLIRLTKDYNHT